VSDEHPELTALRRTLEAAESAYAAALAAVDALARLPAPRAAAPDLMAARERVNRLWERVPPPGGGGPAGAARRQVWQALAPALDQQRDFNSAVVQVLNAQLEDASGLLAALGELASGLVQYLQQVLPVMDARDRVATGLATTRAELVLEAFDRRLETLGRRLEGLLALRDRVEAVSEQVGAITQSLSTETPSAARAAALSEAADDSLYAAFENRFRGDRDELRERFLPYADAFRGHAPVLELGCGRGEFLEILREAGIDARGVDLNARFAEDCRSRGLAVIHADLLAHLRASSDASLGGIFAAQVVEHLAPALLLEVLGECHRALREDGLMILETVNPRSLVGFLEVFNRDLTHQKPLHPETLSFLAAAKGFTDVRVEPRAPVEPADRLRQVPADGLPADAAAALNENVARLNALVFGPREYALIARR
jgi:O-antigen chain-terminating methyltransferase